MHSSSAAAAMTACAESMISAGLVDSPLHPTGLLTRKARDAVLEALLSSAVGILAGQRGLPVPAEGWPAPAWTGSTSGVGGSAGSRSEDSPLLSPRAWATLLESWLKSFPPSSALGCPEILASLYQALLDLDIVAASGSSPLPGDTAAPGTKGPESEWRSRSWNGRRKGSGSFYTPESVCRHMASQAFAAHAGSRPEQLLDLRICDPAAGAGSILVAALHQVAGLLRSSLDQWDRIRPREEGTACLLGENYPTLELPGRPGEERFESALGRALRRMIGRRCLHGADLDPHAASLCRRALWLEIGDPGLSPDDAAPGVVHGDSLLGLPWWETVFPGVFEIASDGAPSSFGIPAGESIPRAARARGFDLVLGNPPWDTLQPNSREFFSGIDPAFRALGKQEGLRRQAHLLERHPELREEWEAVTGSQREQVRLLRSGGLFRLQGKGKAYTYKLFLELADRILAPGGRLALILPSGIYSDLESRHLRDMLLDSYEWESLYGMENRARLFQADSRLKFCLIQARKGGTTRAVRTAFVRRAIPGGEEKAGVPRRSDPRAPEKTAEGLLYTPAQVRALSPQSHAFLELRSRRDQELMLKMADHGLSVGPRSGGAWRVSYRQGDLNLTGASRHFIRREEAEKAGFRPDLLGRWIRGERPIDPEDSREVLLPILQGAMIGELAPFNGVYARGAGHGVHWRRHSSVQDIPVPQFLIRTADLKEPVLFRAVRVVLRTQSNATNARTMVAAPVEGFPCGNSLGLLRIAGWTDLDHAAAAGFLCSLVFDWQIRQRMAGTNCNEFLLRETLWPRALHGAGGSVARAVLGVMASELAFQAPRQADLLRSVREEAMRRMGNVGRADRKAGCEDRIVGSADRNAGSADQRDAAVGHSPPDPLPRTRSERTEMLACLDAAAAVLMGLDREDLEWIVRDCAHPLRDLRNVAFTSRLDPKGFWRVDRDLEPAERRTAKALGAYDHLLRCIREAGGDRAAGLVRLAGGRAPGGQPDAPAPFA